VLNCNYHWGGALVEALLLRHPDCRHLENVFGSQNWKLERSNAKWLEEVGQYLGFIRPNLLDKLSALSFILTAEKRTGKQRERKMNRNKEVNRKRKREIVTEK